MLGKGSAVALLHRTEANSMNTDRSSQGCSSVTASGESLPLKTLLCLDFTSSPVTIQHNASDLDSVQPLWGATVEA